MPTGPWSSIQERGTTTAVLAINGSTTGIVASSQILNWTRAGDIFFFTLVIRLTSKGTNTGNLTITGFPYGCDVSNDVQPSFCTQCNNMATTVTSPITGSMIASTTARLNLMGSGTLTTLTDAHLTDTSVIRISGFYRITY